MKVKELIEKLQTFDPDLEVRILNQEFGCFESIDTISSFEYLDSWGFGSTIRQAKEPTLIVGIE